MFVYVVRKLANTIPIIFGVVLLVFILFNLVGGNPALQMVGKHATQKQIDEISHKYGYDLPKSQQFVRLLKQVVTFDFDESYATHRPIKDMILSGVGPSLSLAIPAFFLTTILSVIIGLFVAYHRGTYWDKGAVILCVVGMSLPMMAYILFGQYFIAYKLGWFPISGYESDLGSRFTFVALPALIWIIVGLGYDVRFYRTAILEEVTQDYVRTARAKGLSERKIFLKHVLKNTMIPILTNVVLEIPLLVLGAFLLEDFFGIPGLGSITIDAVHNSDFPVLIVMTVLQALLMIFGNLLTDLLYTVVDPRVSLQ
jgi:peptide/nickel transport system permease protein